MHRGAMNLRLKQILVTVCLVSSFATVAAAGPIDDAVSARLKGVYEAGLRILRTRAEKGDASAQSSLGFMYATGQGVKQDDAEAAKWYRLAAERGRANAQYNIGAMYAKGQGVPQDYNEAQRWWRAAAEQ